MSALTNCLLRFMYQKLVHCDLKPENIVLRELGRSSVVVIDFGSSCYEGQTKYTYIQVRHGLLLVAWHMALPSC